MSSRSNSRCGLFIGIANLLSPIRQTHDRIAVMDSSSAHRIFQLEFETLRGTQPAMNRKRAAEHQRAFGEPAFGIARDQILGMAHRCDRSLLIERALAFDRGV